MVEETLEIAGCILYYRLRNRTSKEWGSASFDRAMTSLWNILLLSPLEPATTLETMGGSYLWSPIRISFVAPFCKGIKHSGSIAWFDSSITTISKEKFASFLSTALMHVVHITYAFSIKFFAEFEYLYIALWRIISLYLSG